MVRHFNGSVKTLLASIAFLFAVSSASAQQIDKITEGAKTVAAQMKTQLVLNDNQYTQVVDVNKTYLVKVKDCKASGDTAAAKAKKMQALNEERDGKLKSVLTETQYKKYGAMRSGNIKKLKESAGL